MDGPLRSASRSSLLPPHSGGTSTTDNSQEVSPIHSNSSDPTTAGTSGFGGGQGGGGGGGSGQGGIGKLGYNEGGYQQESSTSPSGQPYVYPFQPPDPSPPPLGNPYFSQSFALPLNQRQQPSQVGTRGEPFYNQFGQGGDQFSPDELSFGMRGMNLGGGGTGGNSGGSGQQGGVGGGNVPGQLGRQNSIPGGGREPPTRQNSSGFQPYYMASPASPYLPHQDAYSPISFGAPSPFYSNAMPNGGLSRRDSMCVPTSFSISPALSLLLLVSSVRHDHC